MFFCFFVLLKMPELPEVETIKKQLSKKVIGKKIKNVDIFAPKLINLTPEKFKSKIADAKIEKISRRAKNLILELSDGLNLLFHLKMTGQLIYIDKNSALPENKHTHLIFHFFEGDNLIFNDLRKFGYVKLLSGKELEVNLEKQRFGPEPLEKNFTLKKFQELLKRKKGKIKVVLMDQTFIAGIGNLYAAEICFYAKVKPDKELRNLTDTNIKDLYDGIKKILAEAIKHKGSSVENYVDIYGKQGEFVPFLKVYGRKGKECYRCGGIIQTIKLGGRGTYFCPNCQK